MLIVDDHATHRTLLSAWLDHWGFTWDSAENTDTAIEKLQASTKHHTPFSLALIDIHLPGTELLICDQYNGRLLMKRSAPAEGQLARR